MYSIFGVFLCFAFVSSSFLIWHFAKNEINESDIFDYLLVLTFFSLFIGRIFFILQNSELFKGNLLTMFHFINYPGISYLWSLIAGIFITVFFSWKKKIKTSVLMDIFSLGIAFGTIFGEIGYFFGNSSQSTYPISLFKAISSIFIFILIFYVNKHHEQKKDHYSQKGKIASIYFLFFSLSYFLLEFLNESSVYLLSFYSNQLLLAIITIISALFFTGQISGEKFNKIGNFILILTHFLKRGKNV